MRLASALALKPQKKNNKGFLTFFSTGASEMLILCLELIRSRLGIMNVEMRRLFFVILSTLIEKSPVSTAVHTYSYSVSNNVKVGLAGKMLKCVHSYGTVRSSGTAMFCEWNPKCDNLNESYWVVLSCGTVYYTVEGGSNFCVSGWNPRRNRVTIYMKVPGLYRVCPFQSVLLSFILWCWCSWCCDGGVVVVVVALFSYITNWICVRTFCFRTQNFFER